MQASHSRKRGLWTAVTGAIITLVASGLTWQQESRGQAELLRRRAVTRVELARQHVERARLTMDLLLAFYRASDVVTAAEFAEFAAHVLRADFGARWIAWLPDRSDDVPTWPPQDAKPTRFVAPAGYAGEALAASALPDGADAEGVTAITLRVDDHQLLLLRQRPFAVGTGGTHQRGQLAVATDLLSMLEISRRTSVPAGLDAAVGIDAPDGELLAFLPSREREGTAEPPADWHAQAETWASGRVQLGALRLVLASFPAPEAAPPLPQMTLAVFALGALLTAALAHGFVTTERARHRAEALVAVRTRQLAEANATLEQHVADRTRELRVAHREVDSLGYSVAHDLRGPVRALSDCVDLLAKDHAAGLSPEGMRLLGIVRKGCADLNRLIDSILRLQRLGRQPLGRNIVDVDALAQEVITEARADGEATAHEFRVGPLGGVVSDPGLLRVVLRSAIGNAIRLTRTAAAPRIELRREDETGAAVFVVADNGVVPDPAGSDDRSAPVQRPPGASAFEDAGVGLALCHRVLARHGGSITGQSSPGRGTTIRIRLPAEPKSA